MGTPLLPEPKSKRNFDEIVRRTPLLFRLHSQDSQTFFHPEENILVASLHRQGLKNNTSEEVLLRLAELEKTPSSLTLKEDNDAVAKHITLWQNDEVSSNFISLTFDIMYVLWEWKRRMSYPRQSGDNFKIIVLKSSELRSGASGGTKLGTELLPKDKPEYENAYRFAQSHSEVIVAKYIRSTAILGSMLMSKLEDFIPPWFQKIPEHEKNIPGSENKPSFSDFLPPEVDEVHYSRAYKSLRFALVLLAPMLVPGGQRPTDNGSTVGCNAVELPRAEDVDPKIGPRSGLETVSGKRVAEDGYVLIQNLPRPAETNNNSCFTSSGILACRKRSHSPEIEGRISTTEDSPRQEPLAKRRRLSEVESTKGSADAVRNGQDPAEPLEWESECVGILATAVCRVKWKGQKKCKEFCTTHGHEILKLFSIEIQKYVFHA